MSIKFSFPVCFDGTAIPRGKKKPVSKTFVEHVDVEIPVVDPDDAPIAVAWRETNINRTKAGHTVWAGDAHYFATGIPEFKSDADAESVIREFLTTSNTRITDIHSTFDHLRSPVADVTPYDSDRLNLIDDRGRNKSFRVLDELISRLVVVGNKLHFRGLEPSYGVNRAHLNRGGMNRAGPQYSYYIRDVGKNTASTAKRYFSLNDFESVRLFSPGAARHSGRYEVDVFMPETLTLDHDAFNLLNTALSFSSFATYSYGRGVHHGDWSPETDGPLLRLHSLLPPLGDLRDVSEFPRDLDFDGIADEIENLYPYVWVDCTDRPDMRAELRYVERVIDDWRNRGLRLNAEGFAP